MVDRQEVQWWLSACTVADYDTPDGDNSHASFEVPAPTLAALCRAWLSIQDAPEVCVDGQRVRIVPEGREGGHGG